jgi:hypothetical protein
MFRMAALTSAPKSRYPKKRMSTPSDPKRVRFEFIKSPDYRTITVDGVFGGISPRGAVFASFFVERPSIPTVTVYELENGRLGSEVKELRVDREGIVREVQVGLVLDLEAATRVRDWLNNRIDQLSALKDSIKEGE